MDLHYGKHYQRLLLGVLSRSPNVRNAPKEDNCYISLFKTKTHHPCRQTRISKNETLKILRPVDFIFQINLTRQPAHIKWTAREGCLPKEDQNSSSVLREVSPAAVIYHGGLITLPPVPLRYKDLRLQNLA